MKKNVCKIFFKKCTYMKDNNDTEYEKHLLNIRNTL